MTNSNTTSNEEEPQNNTDFKSARYQDAICCLIEGKTLQATADASSINVRTLRRWMEHPEFINEYDKARKEHLDNVKTRLQAAADVAAETLLRLATCGIPSVELTAARTIMMAARKDAEQMERNQKTKDLEKRIADQDAEIEKLKANIKHSLQTTTELDNFKTALRNGTFKAPDWITSTAWTDIVRANHKKSYLIPEIDIMYANRTTQP